MSMEGESNQSFSSYRVLSQYEENKEPHLQQQDSNDEIENNYNKFINIAPIEDEENKEVNHSVHGDKDDSAQKFNPAINDFLEEEKI